MNNKTSEKALKQKLDDIVDRLLADTFPASDPPKWDSVESEARRTVAKEEESKGQQTVCDKL